MPQAVREDAGEAHDDRCGQIPGLQALHDIEQIDLATGDLIWPDDDMAGVIDGEIALAPGVDVVQIE